MTTQTTPVFSMKRVTERLDNLLKVETPRRVRKGLEEAGKELLRMAVELPPKAPVDTTSLIGSGGVFVDGVWKYDSPYGVPGTHSFRGMSHEPAEYTDYRTREGEENRIPNTFVAEVVFNAPYAAEQHEMWPEKQEIRVQGAGIHFIGVKIGLYYPYFMRLIVKELYLGE